MTTKLTYRISRADGAYLARCEELALESTGSSPDAALAALKQALEQHFVSVEAVAPPSRPPRPPELELVPVRPQEPEAALDSADSGAPSRSFEG